MAILLHPRRGEGKGTCPSPPSSHAPRFFDSHSMGFRCKVPERSRDPSRWKPQDVSGGAAPGSQERLPRCAPSAGSPKLPTVDPVCARRPRPSPPESPPTSAAASHWRPRASVGPRAPPGGSADRGPHPAPLEPASRREAIPGAGGRPRRLTDRRRRLRARPQRAAGMAAPRSPPRVRAREREGPRAPTAGGRRAGGGEGARGQSPCALRVGRSGAPQGRGLQPQNTPGSVGAAVGDGGRVASEWERALGRQICLGRGRERPAEAGRAGSWEEGARLVGWNGVGGSGSGRGRSLPPRRGSVPF